MIERKVYEYLTGVLTGMVESAYASATPKGRVRNTYRYFGVKHKQVSKRSVAIMGHYIEGAICDAGKRLILSDGEGVLYAYNGMYYVCTGAGTVFLTELVKRVMVSLGISEQYVFYAPQYISGGIYRTLTGSDEYEYRPDRRYIVFRNGVFDVMKGVLKGFSTSYATDIVLDIDYMELGALYVSCAGKYGISREVNPCKLWEWKVEEILPDAGMREGFQQFCGSLLINREECKVEYVCYLIGSGSNGKSVLASVVAGVFGERYFSRFSPRQLFKDSDARVNIAALRGKLANLVGDLDERDISGGDFKRFASGEKFQGRENYARRPIQVSAPPLLCCANTMPEASDDSWGHHRRQLPIHTTTRQWTEGDKDPYLVQKLTVPEARMRVFLWIYEGYKKIMRNGGNIELGESVIEAQERLCDRSNSVRRWWDDSGYRVPREGDSAFGKYLKELEAEYVKYCEESGDVQMKGRPVSAMLRSKGVENRRDNRGTIFFIARESG